MIINCRSTSLHNHFHFMSEFRFNLVQSIQKFVSTLFLLDNSLVQICCLSLNKTIQILNLAQQIFARFIDRFDYIPLRYLLWSGFANIWVNLSSQLIEINLENFPSCFLVNIKNFIEVRTVKIYSYSFTCAGRNIVIRHRFIVVYFLYRFIYDRQHQTFLLLDFISTQFSYLGLFEMISRQTKYFAFNFVNRQFTIY